MIYDLRFTNALRSLLLFLCAFAPLREARSADFQVVAYVTITNTPAGPPTNIVFNIGTSDTRTSTNGVVTPSTSFQITNSTAATRTNLAAHLVTYPVYSLGSGSPQLTVVLSSSNTSALEFWAPINTNLSVSFGGNWATVYYQTNPLNLSNPVLVDTNRMDAIARTNAVNALANLLAGTNVVPSNSIPPGAKIFQHYTDQTSSQNLSNKTLTTPVITGGRHTGVTNFTGTNVALTNVTLSLAAIHNLTELNGYLGTLTNGVFWSNLLHRASISNALIIGGNIYRFTNGYWTNAIFDSPKATNLVSYNISSPGGGSFSEQFGSGAHAWSDYTSSFGYGAIATNQFAHVFGYQGFASEFGTVFGALCSASTNSTSIGYGNGASGVNGTLIGNNNDANGYYNIILIGSGINATADNQVTIGGSGQSVVIGGTLIDPVLTNASMTGITTLRRIDLTPRSNTGLANGYNSGVLIGTNSYVRFSGPTAAYTNAGFAAPVPAFAHRVLLQFDNPGLSFTLLNESGIEATAANRILTNTGALENSTNNPVMVDMIYDTTASRYRLISIR